MRELVKVAYNDISVSFTEDAWFNATAVGKHFSKDAHEWLSQRETAEYIAALAESITSNSGFVQEFNEISKLDGTSAASRAQLLRLVKKAGLVKTKAGPMEHGGGTWLHPKLAVAFARWLDVRFAVWCDAQIDVLLKGKTDWKRLRHEATASYKVMGQILQMTRQRLGKTCAPHHFSNEARLINWAMTGQFGKVDRDALDAGDLDLLAKLENLDSVLLGCSKSYDDRKKELERFAGEQRALHAPQLAQEDHHA